MQTVYLKKYRFSLSGLQLIYTYKGENFNVSLDPLATCQLLQDMKQIEGFDIDRNGEPVILYSESATSYGYCFWFEFVKTYPLNFLMCRVMADHLEDCKGFVRNRAMIINMFSPLAA